MSVEIGGARRLSYSQFSSYVTCAKQYQLSRVVKVREVPAWYLVGGTTVHRITESIDALLQSDTGRSCDITPAIASEWVQEFHAEIERVEEKSGVPRAEWRAGGRASKEWPNKESYEWWLKNGLEMGKRYIAWRRKTPLPLWVAPTGEAAIELAIETKIGGVDVKMIIDRVFTAGKHLMICDIKCGRLPEQTFQLGFYRAGLSAAYGVDAVIGSYWMGRDGGLSEFYGLGHYTPELLGGYLRDFVRAVDGGIFLPHPTRLCSTCAVRDYCAVQDGPLAAEYDPAYNGGTNGRGMEVSGIA
jgi:hypothetical protein